MEADCSRRSIGFEQAGRKSFTRKPEGSSPQSAGEAPALLYQSPRRLDKGSRRYAWQQVATLAQEGGKAAHLGGRRDEVELGRG